MTTMADSWVTGGRVVEAAGGGGRRERRPTHLNVEADEAQPQSRHGTEPPPAHGIF